MEGLDSKNDRSRALDTPEGDDKRRQRSSKHREAGGSREGEGSDGSERKRSSAEDRDGSERRRSNTEDRDGSERRRSSTEDRDDSRKRSSGTRRADYDDYDYEARKESRSKKFIKSQEDSSSLENSSNWYEEREHDKKHEGGYVRKSASKYSDKGLNFDRDRDRDTTYIDQGDIIQEKSRSGKKSWDDTDAMKNVEEVNYAGDLIMRRGKFTDIKPESVGDISMAEQEDGLGGKSDIKSRDRVGERIDPENKREKLEALEDDYKGRSPMVEERLEKGKIEENRSSVSRNDIETRERSFNSSDDRNRRESDHHEIANVDMEKGIISNRKEPEKEGYRDERPRGRDHEREWEVGYRSQGRYGRRDMAMKPSAYGASDVIEIQTKPFDRINEPPQQSETKPGPNAGLPSSDDLSNTRNSDENDFKGPRNSTMLNRTVSGVEPGSPFNRGVSQGSRGGRGVRGRPGGREREGSQQPYGVPMPIMGSPFGPMGMVPPGPMQPLNPNMSPSPFMPNFPPLVWPGLAVPPNLSPVPPRFPSNLGNPQNPALFFNQPPNISSPGVNVMVPFNRGQNQDKGSAYDFPVKTIRPPGKAPSRGEQNDYSQNFVDTGMRPQNYIRELELTAVVEDYPRLRELIQKKDEIVTNSNTAPMYYKCDLREHVLSPEFFGTKFDVILVDPPWEEYVHRAPGVTDHMEYWTFEEIMNLKIEAIADTPSFIFLWVGDGVGLEQGRQCLKKWGFRRCEDICWVKTNKTNATPGLRHDSHTLFQRSKEHCLMGIKGTVRRSTDGHVIHANIDTDVIIAEEPPYGSTAKPEDMYRIVEHFALGRRRLELFGEDHNIRSGWLTVGKGLTSSNFNTEGYIRNFADKDGKVWQGGGGRNPPPEAPHLVVTTPDIEALRPKSPMKNQMQLQQQSNSISVTTVNNTPSRMPTFNQEASSSSFSTPGPWANMEPFKGGNISNDDRTFDMYGYNVNSGQSFEEYQEFERRRGLNLL